MKTHTIKVKPDVLKSLRYYARQKTPKVLEHFQKSSKLKFKVDDKYLKEIETSEHELNLGLVKELATLYKFPLSCFLLPKPLKDDLVPPDYRKVSADQKGIVSPKGAIALRWARRAQYVISTLNDTSADLFPKVRLQDDPEKVALKALELLPKAFKVQEKSSNPYDFFVELRNSLGELGIVVLKMTFPLDDARAFSLTDQKPYTIVINNKDGTEFGYSPKIFSLLHEFGHILLREGGLCNDFSSDNTIAQEVFCNAFAAACLIPTTELRLFLDEKKFNSLTTKEQIETIDALHKRFLVSGEVVIRKMHTIGYITWDSKDSLLVDWNKYAVRYRKNTFIPKLSQSQKCVGKNGTYYTQTVFDGIARGAVTPEKAVSYLGIKLKHFNELRGVVSRIKT